MGDKSENSRGNDAETLDSIKPEVTVIPPVADGYIVSYLSVPMLNQLPPTTRYSGKEQPDGVIFQDWLEQFESVSLLGGWISHAKLVNLSTTL